ncbi:MAG: type II toxin-antitoxin system VapB family antitoxin [Burkholderiaceae bacterium]|jgi:Arc/MetJ family transcription regulator
MRTTVTIDEELLIKAQNLCQTLGNNDLIREGLKALIQRESAKRLALLGGSDPKANLPSRRKSVKIK